MWTGWCPVRFTFFEKETSDEQSSVDSVGDRRIGGRNGDGLLQYRCAGLVGSAGLLRRLRLQLLRLQFLRL